MKDKLHQFFSDNNVDLVKPHSGHLKRFEKNLNASKKHQKNLMEMAKYSSFCYSYIGFLVG